MEPSQSRCDAVRCRERNRRADMDRSNENLPNLAVWHVSDDFGDSVDSQSGRLPAIPGALRGRIAVLLRRGQNGVTPWRGGDRAET